MIARYAINLAVLKDLTDDIGLYSPLSEFLAKERLYLRYHPPQ
jgi:hypothetical protein